MAYSRVIACLPLFFVTLGFTLFLFSKLSDFKHSLRLIDSFQLHHPPGTMDSRLITYIHFSSTPLSIGVFTLVLLLHVLCLRTVPSIPFLCALYLGLIPVFPFLFFLSVDVFISLSSPLTFMYSLCHFNFRPVLFFYFFLCLEFVHSWSIILYLFLRFFLFDSYVLLF